MTTRNPKEAKARQTTIVKDCKLEFLPYPDPHKWPQQHTKTFGNIQKLGATQFGEWKECLDVHWAKYPSKVEMDKDVGYLVQKAQDFYDEEPNEIGWRLALEALLFRRFNEGASCAICDKRLWRSDIDPISHQQDESTQSVCVCKSGGPLGRRPMKKSYFLSREDAFVAHTNHVKKKLEKMGEKPDKVYALCQSGSLLRLLRSQPKASNEQRTLEEELEPTLFPNDTNPGVFPFLLMESKREGGSTFKKIDQQMAIVLHKSLSIQKRLHTSACSVNEWTDSPLCWSLSHIGARWRVAAGYEVISSRRDFDVATLWTGNIDQPSGALQLLLILEYICDWARYVHRRSMIRGLKKLASPGFENMSDIASSARMTVTSIMSTPTQRDITDFVSPNRTHEFKIKLDKIGSWKPEMDASTAEDPFKQFDSKAGIIRDAKFVGSQAMGLYITGSTFELFVNSFDSDRDARKFLRNIRRSLNIEKPLLMSMSDMKDMEIAWTGTSHDFWGQNDHAGLSSEELFHVLLTFSAFITPEWDLKRELCYLAISESAMKLLFQNVQSGLRAYPVGERISPDAIAKFIGRHNQTSVAQTLSACLYRSSNCACMQKKDPDESPDVLFEDHDFVYFVEQSRDEGSRGIVWSLYVRHKVGRNEPAVPLLRLSSRNGQQALLNEKVNHELSPWTTFNIKPSDRAVLAHSSKIEGVLISQKATDCIFTLDRVHATNYLSLTNTYFEYSFLTERAAIKDPQELTWNVKYAQQKEGARQTGNAILACVKAGLDFDVISDSEIVRENASDKDYETESADESDQVITDESEKSDEYVSDGSEKPVESEKSDESESDGSERSSEFENQIIDYEEDE